jgi:hypothetical protein
LAQVAESTRVTHFERAGRQLAAFNRCGPNGSSVVDAEWLMDCTGRRSWLARREKIKRRAYDSLTAFVMLFIESQEHSGMDKDSLTLVESAEEGWWYHGTDPK